MDNDIRNGVLMAMLTVLRGVRAGQRFFLSESEKIKVGRESHCNIHFRDSETSRNHAEFSFRDGRFWVRDLGSSNGTFVNELPITEQALEGGDRLQIGRQLLLFAENPNSGKSMDGEVAIVPASGEDASQIVGRLLANTPLSDKTEDWHGKQSQDFVPGPPSTMIESRFRSHWEVMYRTSLAVSRTMDIDQLLNQIMDLIFQWVLCDRGCIMLLDSTTGELYPSCRKNRKSQAIHRMAISRTILDYVTKQGEGVLTSDACEDDRWSTSASISAGGIREAICVPMKGRYGIVGAIYIDTTTSPGKYASRSDRVFHEEHLKLLVAIGHQAALAIEDTSFYQTMVQAERLAIMGQTIATLSHHIKNIVQGLKGGGYLVDEGLKRDDLSTVSKGWRICLRNQERIEALVVDMLTMSKDRTPIRQAIDLRDLIEDVIELENQRASEAGIILVWSRPSEEDILQLDGEALHRAILNLVSNAIDACKEKEQGTVNIALTMSKESARILISDNGTGIAKSDLERIFSMFESNKGSRGTGLGLPVSLKIAQEHGGTIKVESEIGVGTTFVIELPRKENSLLATDNPKTMAE
ncbi:MAG: ATP-binding protein [Pirellula sp.]|nr:ATP-binding protein [Pirellula sp.]